MDLFRDVPIVFHMFFQKNPMLFPDVFLCFPCFFPHINPPWEARDFGRFAWLRRLCSSTTGEVEMAPRGAAGSTVEVVATT